MIDTYDHNGNHIQIDRPCICERDTHSIYIDGDRECLVCSDCGKIRPMLTYHHMMTQRENIESWLLKTGL